MGKALDALKAITVIDGGEGLYVCVMDETGAFSFAQPIDGGDLQRAFADWRKKRDEAIATEDVT